MDCCTFCTAASYNIKSLFETFRTRFPTHLHRDAVHVEMPFEDGLSDIFYFSYGTVVCWNLSLEQGWQLIEHLKAFEQQPLDEIESDAFTFSYGPLAKFVEDDLTLPDTSALTKLAASQGLSQSVKLGAFESSLLKIYNQTKYLPEELAKLGRIPLSRSQIRKKMGELFIERNSITLHIHALASPDFFWEYPEFEKLHLIIVNELDIKDRTEVLNHRLDVVRELFEMLGSELNHQHSSRLEWTIIWLIILEVLLTLLRDVFRII
ncbi:RMD1 family protein [Parachlamydia sp. AcF125]|uniref:RMD1 family protein n=1 Tax=Parachlamydia sp. AcF125 TaxID=2795736 RepID=UPI001BC95296|nr:RMD1 family protein [Parachlamydia sp. AcF125]MBS4169133.1 hypothetical protein [Parachlamydia sp. AcF125]